MASNVTRGRAGFTRLTKERGAAMPSGIFLQDKDGFDWGIWPDTSGDLRIAEASAIEASDFDPEADGTVVGAQS